LVVGRKGHQTRFELAESDAQTFVDEANIAALQYTEGVDDCSGAEKAPTKYHGGSKPRVFITRRRMNKKIVEQVKELLLFGKFDPVVAPERETTKPLPHDVMDEMRGCVTAVIHVGFDALLLGGDRNEEPHISGDVLIELGAAMALFGRNFIVLVEEGVTLPANLHGLCPSRRRRIGHAGHDDAVQGLQRHYEVPAHAALCGPHRCRSPCAARASIRANRHLGSCRELN
jgi:Predicted nucleotide-binding protein containing TIR-like domain